MIRDLQLTVGDVCGDTTGLRVKVDDIDTYNRVHFSIVEENEEHWTLRGEMSRDSFMHRFISFMHRFIRMYSAQNRVA